MTIFILVKYLDVISKRNQCNMGVVRGTTFLLIALISSVIGLDFEKCFNMDSISCLQYEVSNLRMKKRMSTNIDRNSGPHRIFHKGLTWIFSNYNSNNWLALLNFPHYTLQILQDVGIMQSEMNLIIFFEFLLLSEFLPSYSCGNEISSLTCFIVRVTRLHCPTF